VNSGMRHRSACRRRTTSHCCHYYCYFGTDTLFNSALTTIKSF